MLCCCGLLKWILNGLKDPRFTGLHVSSVRMSWQVENDRLFPCFMVNTNKKHSVPHYSKLNLSIIELKSSECQSSVIFYRVCVTEETMRRLLKLVCDFSTALETDDGRSSLLSYLLHLIMNSPGLDNEHFYLTMSLFLSQLILKLLNQWRNNNTNVTKYN